MDGTGILAHLLKNNMNVTFVFTQHIDKVFKHKELQQQLVDVKLQRTAELMREVEEKQQREREFVSILVIILILFLCWA